jgi:hypothetical protein
MAGDEHHSTGDVPTLQQLLEHAEVLQHDFEQAEHHRQADDHGIDAPADEDPHNRDERDLIEFIRNHRGFEFVAAVCVGTGRYLRYQGDSIAVYEQRRSPRYIDLDGPTDGPARDW